MTSENPFSRRTVLLCVVIALSLTPSLIKLVDYPHNIGSDDAYIHLRVATELVRGQGWGVNPHSPVNLSTAPAFTLLLAAVKRVTGDGVLAMQVLSCGATALGLLAIFGVARAETGSVIAALLAEATAAFSVNLWRWNGTLMETTFAFALVAWVLYLFRGGVRQNPRRSTLVGIVLGVGILLRPEIALLALLAGAVLAARSASGDRLLHVLWMMVGFAMPLGGWLQFAKRQRITAMPTTYAAKSATGLLLLNVDLVKQYLEALGASLLLPGVLVLAMACVGLWKRRWTPQSSVPYVMPLGFVAGLFAFYYLKMPGLESPGRYLLLLLPCEALLLALLWTRFRAGGSGGRPWVVAGVLGVHAVLAIVVNERTIAPVLRRFETEYGTTAREAAEELARRTAGKENRRVLVVSDIGLLSYAGDGRFEIVDARALATPSLRGLDTKAQIERVRPAFVVQSLSPTPEGFEAERSGELHRVWERRFLQHGVRVRDPFYYTIIFERSGKQ